VKRLILEGALDLQREKEKKRIREKKKNEGEEEGERWKRGKRRGEIITMEMSK
jgi:ribosomal protein L19E